MGIRPPASGLRDGTAGLSEGSLGRAVAPAAAQAMGTAAGPRAIAERLRSHAIIGKLRFNPVSNVVLAEVSLLAPPNSCESPGTGLLWSEV